MTAPGESFATATEAGRAVIASLPAEHEWAFNRPGYGTGWTAAEELRLAGEEEPFLLHQAITWQARVGPTAVVDTFLAREPEPVAITPLRHWPYKTINTKEHSFDVPDLLVR